MAIQLERGAWRLPLQRRGARKHCAWLTGLPDECASDEAVAGSRRTPFDSMGRMELVHWAPPDHRFRPYRWRVGIDGRTRCRLGLWTSPENPLPAFLPWLHERVGRSAATWTARLVYCPRFRDGMRWQLYFVRDIHVAAFVARWSVPPDDQPAGAGEDALDVWLTTAIHKLGRED